MTVIGSASINIRADDKYFEPDVRRAVAKIKDLRIALKVDADMSAANKKLRDLRYRMSQNEVQIKIRANDVGFEADVRAAVRKIKNVQIELKTDVDVAKASKKIRDLRYRITSKDAILKVDANLAKAEEKMRKFLEKFINTDVNIHAKAHTGEAHTALSDLQTRYGKNVRFTATADTKLARAALAYAARTRRTKIIALVDPTSLAAIKGIFNTVTGTLPFDKVKKSIAGVLANFEQLAVTSALVGTALLSVGGAALTLGANLFSIGGDITQVIGIAAMLPAAFASMVTIIVANKMAWKDFGAAVSEVGEKGAEALAKLPPNAQKAAVSLRGVYTEIQKPVQNAFWEKMEDSIGNMIDSLLPSLIGGMSKVGSSMGGITKSVVDAFARLGDGTLERMFGNLASGLENMTEGAGAFVDALNILGAVGSTYLPALGSALNDSALRFRDFISEANDAGRINDWIDTSIQRFKELGSIVGSTTAIMGGLTEIARLSGAPGLTEMANGFRNIADTVNSEPFRSQLVTILEGARSGTGKLAEGIGTLTELFWKSSESVGVFLDLAGEIAGLTFENITSLFDGTGLGTGLHAALLGLRDGMGELGPGFADMGDALGGLGEIAGELFRTMAPSLNMLAETIAGVVGGLKGGILDAMPVFNEFVQAVMNLASGPLILLAQGIGGILSAFAGLPGVIQTVVMSLGLLLLLAPKFSKFFGGMAASLRKEDSQIGNNLRSIRDNATTTMRSITSATEGTGTATRRVFSESAKSASAMFGTMGKEAAKAGEKMASGIGSAAAATTTALRPVAAGFKEALAVDGDLNRVRDKLGETSGKVAGFAKEQGNLVKGQFSDMATYSSGRMDEIGNKAKEAFGKIPAAAGAQATLVKNQFADMGRAIDHSLAYIPSRAATAFAPIATSAADAARGTAGAFKDTGEQIGRGFSAASGHVRRVAGQINNDLAPARAAFTGLVSHATAAGQAAGAGFGGGVSKAVSGLSGALGGGWGLAIAGATIALGLYAQKAAESKSRTEELSKVLQNQGGEFEAIGEKMLAMNVLDGITNGWDDAFRGIVEMSKSVEESFDILGISAADVGKELADSSSRDAYLQGWEKIQTAIINGTEVTDTMAAAVGTTTEELEGVNRMDLRHLRSALEGAAEEAEKAELRARTLGEAFNTSSVSGAAIAKNFDTLASSTSSVSEKVSALKQNLDLMNGGVLTATEAESAYHQTLRTTNDALTTMIANNDGVTKGLLGVGGAFDVTTAKGDALFQTLNTQKDAILEMGVATLQSAISAGDSLPAAQAKALATMDTQTAAMRAHLESVGFKVPEIDAMLKTLGLNPDQLKAALVVESGQAEVDIARTALAAQAYAQGNFSAALSALPDAAKSAILDATGMAEVYAEGSWEAVLDAVDKGGDDRAAFVSEMLAASGDAEYMAALKARNEVGPAVDEARAKIETSTWLGVPFAVLDTQDNTDIGLAPARAKMDAWMGLVPPPKPIKATDETDGPLSAAKSKFADFSNPESPKSILAQDDTQFAFDSANKKASDYISDEVKKKVGVEDNAAEGMESVKATVNNGISGMGGGMSRGAMGKITLPIDAVDETLPAVSSAQGTMSMLESVTRGLYGANYAGAATGEAQGTMNTLQSVMRDLQAQNLTGGATAESQATMNTLQSVMRDLQAQNTTGGPTVASQATMNSLQNVMRDLQAQNLTGGPKANAQGTMNSLQSVMRDLNANNQVGGPVSAAQGAIDSVHGTEVDVIANDKGSANAYSVRDAINTVVGRTVDVVTRFLKIGDNADGGIWTGDGARAMAQGGIMKSANNSAVQAFANGGINRGAQQQAIKAFAGGGIENHTAQIARGAWPVRIWAEPETGGEAYIPLSPNKRKRSLAILKEVMAEFGLEHLTHSFADGGINQASRYTTPQVVSSRYAAASSGVTAPVAATPSVQGAAPVVNVYPSKGLSEEQIGVVASDRLWFNIMNSSF